jgi:hypothetical protein
MHFWTLEQREVQKQHGSEQDDFKVYWRPIYKLHDKVEYGCVECEAEEEDDGYGEFPAFGGVL